MVWEPTTSIWFLYKYPKFKIFFVKYFLGSSPIHLYQDVKKTNSYPDLFYI